MFDEGGGGPRWERRRRRVAGLESDWAKERLRVMRLRGVWGGVRSSDDGEDDGGVGGGVLPRRLSKRDDKIALWGRSTWMIFSDRAPVAPWQETFVISRFSIHVMSKHRYHVFVGLGSVSL